MKTIKDLKLVIAEHEGVMKIGGLKFEHKDGEDIDVKLDDALIIWFSKNVVKDETLLEDAEFTITSDIEEGKKAKSEKRELQKTIEELEKQIGGNSMAVGKVEAYEKLLIGREINIGK